MRTELLAKLYKEFEIDNLPLEQHGKTSDRLGKLYERYILEIFKDFKTEWNGQEMSKWPGQILTRHI